MSNAQKKEYRHGEAYCLMTYRSDDGTEEELVWNSRDGVTPFCITLRSGKQATHADWSQDVCVPNFKPLPGMRIFVDISPERCKELAREMAERHWNHPTYPASRHYESIEKLAEALADDFHPGDPELIEVQGSDERLYAVDGPSNLELAMTPYQDSALPVKPGSESAVIERLREMMAEAEDDMLHGSDYYDEPVIPVASLRKLLGGDS